MTDSMLLSITGLVLSTIPRGIIAILAFKAIKKLTPSKKAQYLILIAFIATTSAIASYIQQILLLLIKVLSPTTNEPFSPYPHIAIYTSVSQLLLLPTLIATLILLHIIVNAIKPNPCVPPSSGP